MGNYSQQSDNFNVNMSEMTTVLRAQQLTAQFPDTVRYFCTFPIGDSLISAEMGNYYYTTVVSAQTNFVVLFSN